MKRIKKVYIVFFCLGILFPLGSVNYSHGKTVWCNPANGSIEDGISKSTGYKTLWKAIGNITSGDTIIIAEGNWKNSGQEMSIVSLGGGPHFPPSGKDTSNMTTIRAETDWKVFLPKLDDPGVGREYVCLRGIIFNDLCTIYKWNRCKIIRCGFWAPKRTGNSSAFALSYCQNILVEECIAWGGGRYKFLNYTGKNNIYRRCLARHDWYIAENNTACQEANFRGYGCINSKWQNCISIDSNRIEFQTPKGRSYEDGDFWIGDQTGAGDNEIDGCFVIKGMYQAFYLAGPRGQGDETKVVLRNSVALGPSLEGKSGLTGAITYGAVTPTVVNCLFINFNLGAQHFIAHNKQTGKLILNDSIVRNVGKMTAVSADYNCYFNTKSGNYGRHSINNDPLQDGLLYPVRIEPDSPLASAGQNGTRCGPNILKKIGVSGTLYGETGWDEVTDNNLWPFPNEKKIRELMRETVDGVSGIYGFCKDGQTLTNYIWGYFGNTVPPFNLRGIPGDGKVTLKWNSPAEIALDSITGFNVYRLAGQTKALAGGTVPGNRNCSKTISALRNGSTYEFTVTAIDREKGESGHSYTVRVTPEKAKKPSADTSSPTMRIQKKRTVANEKVMAGKEFANKLGMEFLLIRPGTFAMGIFSNEPEATQHQVTLTKAFYIQKTEVTQGQWKKVMDKNPSFFKKCGDNCSVEQVPWNEVQQFIKHLNQIEGTIKYRLPTEAEWEYACRAGTQAPFSFGNCLSSKEANYNGNFPFMKCQKQTYLEKPASVNTFTPNSWGLIGMHGNVWEWCQNWLGEYTVNPTTDPTGPQSGVFRVIRGGGWNSYAAACRSGNRSGVKPNESFANLGFRLVRDP